MIDLLSIAIVLLIAVLAASALSYRHKIARLEADRDALGEALAEAASEQGLLEDLLAAALRENARGAR